MDRAQAIFWDTFNTVQVAKKVSPESQKGIFTRKSIFKTCFEDNSFLSACNPAICHK